MQYPKTTNAVRGRRPRLVPPRPWGLWLPTVVLTLLCGLTGVSAPNTAWAFIAARQVRAFGAQFLLPRPQASAALATPPLPSKSFTASAPPPAAMTRLASARAADVETAAWRPILAVPEAMASPAPAVTDSIRYAPRPGFAGRMVGGRFQGSADGVSYTTLDTVTQAPPVGRWTTVSVAADLTQYRYLRYLAPNGAYGNIAEVEFDSSGVKLTGTGYGTAGSYANHGNTFAKALDGGLTTFFDAPAPGNGDFVGIDRGAAAFMVVASPATVTGTTTSLSVRRSGTSTGSPAYTWSATGPAAVTFSGTEPSTATFRQAGTYTLTARCVTGSPYTSGVVVTVIQTPTGVTVSPAPATVTAGQTRQFTAAVVDQFGCSVSTSPSFTVSGGGTMSASGLFTAATAGPAFTVSASSGAASGRATVSVQAAPAPPPPPVSASAPAPVQLPIEVMGADGTTATVQVPVPASAAVTSLWLEVHNLSYPDKVSVHVNGGAWVPLDNTTVQVADPGKSYGGIGGAFSTLKMTLPLPAGAVRAGTDTLSFRFNHTDGVSSGFRILAFNFLDADGQPVLPASDFTQDDPDTWQPPLADAQDIAAGQALWQGAHLLQSSIALSPIKAACADCHTDDGRDLKYFNYSNYSIIQRAQFHGLSAGQGAQIASYIRTLNVPSPGRPWDPPYQPGPGLDSRPVQDWAAGAGVDAVLDKSSDMLPYIFPSGMVNGQYNPEDIAAAKNLNVRELPIAMQLPDWNHWLPAVWPGDVAGAEFTGNQPSAFYASALIPRAAAAQANPDAIARGTTSTNIDLFRQALNAFSTQGAPFKDYAALNPSRGTGVGVGVGGGIGPGGIPLTPQNAINMYSTGLWMLTKEWGVNQTYQMEDKVQTEWGPTDAGGHPIEARGWLGGGTFQFSPSFQGVYGDSHAEGGIAARNWASSHNGAVINPDPLTLSPLVAGSDVVNEALDTDWYYLQMILNAGNRHRNGNDPIDWGYFGGRLSNLASVSGVGDIGRATAVGVKQMQQKDNGIAPGQPNAEPDGWSLHDNIPAPDFTSAVYLGTTAPTELALTNAEVSAFLSAAEQYPPAGYWAEQAGTNLPLLAEDSTTAQVSNGYIGSPDPATGIYYSVQVLDKLGVDPALMNDYVGWAQTLLPNVTFAR